MLRVEEVRAGYGKHAVLKGVSFAVDGGEVACILGPNGTGKSTLLRCLLGLHRPTSGRVLADGADITRMPVGTLAKTLAYVPQASDIAFSYQVRDVVLMGRVSHIRLGAHYRTHDKDAAMEALASLKIEHLAQRLFQELSGGEKQMVLIARALAQQASMIVMDEPTANLDYSNQIRILRVLNDLADQGFGIVMTSHQPDHAFLACHTAIMLNEGVVKFHGPPDDVVNTPNLSELYGIEIHVAQTSIRGKPVKVTVPWLG